MFEFCLHFFQELYTQKLQLTAQKIMIYEFTYIFRNSHLYQFRGRGVTFGMNE